MAGHCFLCGLGNWGEQSRGQESDFLQARKHAVYIDHPRNSLNVAKPKETIGEHKDTDFKNSKTLKPAAFKFLQEEDQLP